SQTFARFDAHPPLYLHRDMEGDMCEPTEAI
ncbi:hypothetical protein F443_07394, partial [Phytophthora nicotianae P1569]